jgi:hypothetical protein
MYPEVPALVESVLAGPASDVPVALAVLLVRVAMATDILSVRRQSRPRPTLKVHCRLSRHTDDHATGTRRSAEHA